MENNQNGAVNNRVYGSIIVVLLLINSFTFYQLFIENTKKVDVTSQKAVLEHQFKDLSDTLFVRSNELNLFKGKTAELDQAIADKQEQLDREKKLIQNLFAKAKLSQAELSKARNLIVQYQNSIADLGSQIAALTKQNQELMAANGQLNTDLSLERSIAVKLTEQNKGLAKKVELGSLLPLAKMDVEAIRNRNNGKEVHVKRAKVAESLKISFETGANKVIDAGPVSLYVRIINPKGETIAVTDQGSGTLLSAQVPEPVQYTKKADFDYDQNNKKVVVYWSRNITDPGIYKVEVYQNGYVIGQGQVKLS
jgi:hypothetical protein